MKPFFSIFSVALFLCPLSFGHETECKPNKINLKLKPQELIEEYVRREYSGEFDGLQKSWLHTALDCTTPEDVNEDFVDFKVYFTHSKPDIQLRHKSNEVLVYYLDYNIVGLAKIVTGSTEPKKFITSDIPKKKRRVVFVRKTKYGWKLDPDDFDEIIRDFRSGIEKYKPFDDESEGLLKLVR